MNDESPAKSQHELDDEKAVRSIPLDTEDGGTVVIEQQNMGGVQQVGGGEFKDADEHRSVEAAGAEQAVLEDENPIGQGSRPAESARAED